MRINIVPKTKLSQDDFSFEGGFFLGPILVPDDPVEPLELVNKKYIDDTFNTLSATNITQGTIAVTTIPEMFGDFTNDPGDIFFTLVNTYATAGTYTKFTVDSKGRVVNAKTLTNDDIPNLDWSKIVDGKPTTLAGYGITDGINKNGDTLTGKIKLHADPDIAAHLATKRYTDNITSKIGLVRTGDVIMRPSATVPTGYLRCNGDEVLITDYARLYDIIGDTYNTGTTPVGKFKLPDTTASDPDLVYSYIRF